MARVLVVDDEKLIVKGIRFSLEQDGMEVDCAYDGEEAIELAKKTEYDIVLLDVMLPKYDGYEVCQAIREFSDTVSYTHLSAAPLEYYEYTKNYITIHPRTRALLEKLLHMLKDQGEEATFAYLRKLLKKGTY